MMGQPFPSSAFASPATGPRKELPEAPGIDAGTLVALAEHRTVVASWLPRVLEACFAHVLSAPPAKGLFADQIGRAHV